MFQNIPSDIRVPLFYVEFDPSRAGVAAQNERALLIGQKLPAGTAAADTPVQVSSAAQAKELFGVGSMLAAMMATYRRNDDFGEVWAVPLDDDGAGAAATGTITVTGTATRAGTLHVYVAGTRVRVAVSVGDDQTAVATAIAAAINALTDLPATAGSTLGVVTLTARHKGEAGNDIDLRINYLGALGGETTPAGITVVIVAMSGGTANPALANALAALGDEEYDYVVCPYTDTASLDAIEAEWNDATGRWAWSRQVFGHVFSARRGTVGNLTTFGNARNDPHISVLGYNDAPTPPWEWASAFAAVSAKSLKIDPARPLQTLALTGVLSPPASSRFTLQERNTLLFDGVGTANVSGDGTVRLDRAITTYQKNAFDQPDAAYLDVQTLATLQAVVRELRSIVTTKFARHKLANNGTRVGPGQAVVTPNTIRAELIAHYGDLERRGLVENVAAFTANLIVERNGTDPNRLDVLYTPDLINQLRIFAVQAQFRLQFPAEAA